MNHGMNRSMNRGMNVRESGPNFLQVVITVVHVCLAFIKYNGGQQQVKWNGAVSVFLGVDVGVRQGSILGPLIYAVISMEIPEALGNSVGYADDNTSWACGKPMDELVCNLHSSSSRLVDLSTRLKLSLNPQKTQLLWVGGSSASTPPGVSVAGVMVEPADTIKVLGLELDKKLSAAPYIASLRTSLSQRVGML